MQGKTLTCKVPVVASLAFAVIPLAAAPAVAAAPRWVTLDSVTQVTWYKSLSASSSGLQDIVPVSPGAGTYRFVFTPLGLRHLTVKYIQWGYHCTSATFQAYYVPGYPNQAVPQVQDNTPSYQSPAEQVGPFGNSKPTTATLPASFQVTIPDVPRTQGPPAPRPPVLLGCWLSATAGQSGGPGVPQALEQQVTVTVQRADTNVLPSSATKTALAALAALPVKGRAPKTGYSRAQFGPPWTDDVTVAAGHNGCDTRNDILRRDLTAVVIKPGSNGCTVLSGVLRDPYTNTTIHFNRGNGDAVQIDHMVSLSDAWQTGAQNLTLAARTNLANDPLELLAVSRSANEQKGDADAASWLPSNKAFRCQFVARQVAVKVRYHLWVTPAEHDAIARVLATCASLALPTTAATAPPAITRTATASSGVAIISMTSPVDSGAYATLVAQTAPQAKCDLSVILPSGRESESSGLVTKRPMPRAKSSGTG
jgi:hypothetical protein